MGRSLPVSSLDSLPLLLRLLRLADPPIYFPVPMILFCGRYLASSRLLISGARALAFVRSLLPMISADDLTCVDCKVGSSYLEDSFQVGSLQVRGSQLAKGL